MLGVEIGTLWWGVSLSKTTGLPRSDDVLVLTDLAGVTAVPIFQDRALTVPWVGPVTTGKDGVWPGFVAPGSYRLVEPDGDERVVEGLVGEEHVALGVRVDALETGGVGAALKSRLPFNVKDYGAVGDGVADDTVAVRAAIAACVAVGGGVVWVPLGVYKITGELTIGSNVVVRGEGWRSILIWSTDLGLGKYAVPSTAGGQNLAPRLEQIALYGPRWNFLPTVGTRQCNMDGIQATQWTHMQDVFVTGFGANIAITGDHQKFVQVRSVRGFFNVYFADNSVVGVRGDQGFYGCSFDFAGWANVGVHGKNAITDGHWSSTHLGFAPYGFYKFDSLDTAGLPEAGVTASTVGLLDSCTLDKVQFEEQGNAAILDESTGAGQGSNSLMGCELRGCFHSWGASYKIAARAKDYAVHTRVSRGTRVSVGSTIGFSAGDIAAYHTPTGGITVIGAAFAKMISPGSSLTELGLIQAGDAVGRAFIADGAITIGDILEKHLDGYEAKRYTGVGYPVLGVAAATAATGEMVIVWLRGACNVTSEVVDSGGRWITPFGGGIGHRGGPQLHWGLPNTYAELPALYPAVGISRSSGGAAGGGTLRIDLLGPGGRHDPQLIRPQLVSALPTATAGWRGIQLRVQGGAGVIDTLYECRKKADDTYEWRTI